MGVPSAVRIILDEVKGAVTLQLEGFALLTDQEKQDFPILLRDVNRVIYKINDFYHEINADLIRNRELDLLFSLNKIVNNEKYGELLDVVPFYYDASRGGGLPANIIGMTNIRKALVEAINLISENATPIITKSISDEVNNTVNLNQVFSKNIDIRPKDTGGGSLKNIFDARDVDIKSIIEALNFIDATGFILQELHTLLNIIDNGNRDERLYYKLSTVYHSILGKYSAAFPYASSLHEKRDIIDELIIESRREADDAINKRLFDGLYLPFDSATSARFSEFMSPLSVLDSLRLIAEIAERELSEQIGLRENTGEGVSAPVGIDIQKSSSDLSVSTRAPQLAVQGYVPSDMFGDSVFERAVRTAEVLGDVIGGKLFAINGPPEGEPTLHDPVDQRERLKGQNDSCDDFKLSVKVAI